MNAYRFAVPADLCFTVEADTVEDARRLAEAVRHNVGPLLAEIEAVEIQRQRVQIDAAVWVSEEGDIAVQDVEEYDD